MDRAEDILNRGNDDDSQQQQLHRNISRQEEETQQQQQQNNQSKNNNRADGLPMESSPYVKYSNLEDYKSQAYGATGHLPVNPNQTPAATDAPTPSGAGASSATLAGEGGQSS